MSRPLGPYVQHKMLPDDVKAYSARRPGWDGTQYVIAAIAVVLGFYVGLVGPVDLEAEKVTAAIVEEEVARRAAAGGVPPISLFAADPRELHRLEFGLPLACFPPTREWIRQWGDGRTPYESHPRTGQRAWACVNADLRREIYAP